MNIRIPHITLRTCNNILSLIVVVLAGYLLLAPVAANAWLWWRQKNDPNHGYVYKSSLAPKGDKLKDIPKDNRLVIPEIQFNAPILEGTFPYTLSKGLWHRPNTSTPDQGGNTVVAGHRITYVGPGILYNLDKLKKGDRFSVYWHQKEYVYEVAQISVVSPFDLDVEKNTDTPLFTIYTCTPLWHPTQRLVVQSKPVGGM